VCYNQRAALLTTQAGLEVKRRFGYTAVCEIKTELS